MRRRRHSGRRRSAVQQRAKETVEAIVRATAQILARDGAARLTTNRVAERAGVSIGTLYQYFPHRDALVAEVRRRYDAAFRDRLLAVAGGVAARPLGEAVPELVRALVELHVEDTGLHNAVSARLSDGERALLEQVAVTCLEGRRRDVRRPDVRLAAAVALEAMEALAAG
jgi:AcrR family transcriptional regulator